MANRQTRRKEQKKKKKEEAIEETKLTKDEILNKVMIALVVICILGLFYLLTIYITNKHTEKDDTEEKNETSEVSIDYDKILIGKTFSMSDSDYIVVLYEKDSDAVSSIYSELISSYKEKEDHLPIYYVDMSNSFNKKYSTTEESNKNPTKASELSINGPTLVRITDKKLVDYLEGEESIRNYLS